MYVAKFWTRHFTFSACGTTAKHAAETLLDGWRRYRAANPHVSIPVEAVAEDLWIVELQPGEFYIDGEVMA